MAGPLKVMKGKPDARERAERQPGADTREAPGVFDLVPEQFRVAEDDLNSVQQNRLREKYAPVIEALRERGYAPELLSDPLDLGQGRVIEGEGDYNRSTIWRLIQKERAAAKQAGAADPFPSLPQDRVTFEQPELSRFGQRSEDQAEIARGSFGAQLGSGIIGIGGLELTRPINLATLPFGGVGKTALIRILSNTAIQGTIGAAGLPEIIAGRQNLGEEFTAAEGLMYVGGAAAGGAAFQGLFEGARVVLPKAMRAIDPNYDAKAFARAFEDMVPAYQRTPEQDAALFLLRRGGEIEDVNPFARTHEGIDAHLARMEAALRALEEGRLPTTEEISGAGEPAPVAPPVPQAGPRGFDLERVKAAIRGPEIGGEKNPRTAVNRMGSSATGPYQMIRDTFIGLYQREYGVSEAAARQAWNTRRFDSDVQERLMDRLTLDNAAALQRAGIEADDGNVYLAHFAGIGKAIELLRAPPDAPVSAFFTAKAIRQNPTYLGGGKTVGEAIAIIRGKVGDPAEPSPAPIDPALLMPELRNPDLDAERPSTPLIDEKALDEALPEPVQQLIDPLRAVVTGTRTSLNRTAELASELGTDEATLRQALETLVARGDITQNRTTGMFMRKAPPPLTAANQKRPRTLLEFLAERGGLNDYGGDLQSRGIRLADRKMGRKTIRNVRSDDGTVKAGEGDYGLDSAFRAAREAGYFPELEGRFEGTYADSLDEVDLLLRAIDEELGGSPRYRMDDWDRLPEFKLTGSTEGIYGGRGPAPDVDPELRSSIEEMIARFREDWENFGNDAAALADFDDEFLGRAADLYDRGDAFLPEHALAMVATEDYERALAAAIREGLADEYTTYDPWNPQWYDEFDRRFAAARARDRADGNPLAGSEGVSFDEAYGRTGGGEPQGGRPDRAGQSPAELDAAAAARPRSDHSDLPPEPDPRFAEPDGEGIRAITDSTWHDIDAALKADPNIAARQTQEAQLGAEAPMRATVDQDGTMGLELFDSIDQKSLFDLGDGRGERTVADIRAEIAADRKAIEEIKKCLL